MTKEGPPKDLEPYQSLTKLGLGIKNFPGQIESRIKGGVKARVKTWDLLGQEKTQWISWKLIGFNLREIRLDQEYPFPDVLRNPEGRAIVVSNYPSVSLALAGALRFGAEVPGRLKGIGRQNVVDKASLSLIALGIGDLVYPARKDEAGIYRLERRTLREVMDFLDEPGSLLWMSITGRTRGNGLLERDARRGAAMMGVAKKIPLVPMGMVTKKEKDKLKVKSLRFGREIIPGKIPKDEFIKVDFLPDLTRLALVEIAAVLPPGQRGDFEDIEGKLPEARARVGLST